MYIIWIILTGILCAISSAIFWLFQPQHARGSLRSTMWISFCFGCLAQSIIQWLVHNNS